MSRRRLGSFLTLLVPALAFAMATAGCGSDDDDKGGKGNKPDAGDGANDAGSDVDEGEADGGEEDGGDEPSYTLGEVCDVLAEEQCAAIADCCDSTGVGYDADGCKAGIKKACEGRAARVAAGKLGFDPESVDACNEAMAEIYGKCRISWEETAEMLLGVPACRDVFPGKKAAGEDCTGNEECKAAYATEVAACEAGKCVVRPRFHVEGDDCALDQSDPVACGAGLYCNADASKKGKCEKVKALDEACAKGADALAKFECGWGNYCNQSSGRCTAGNAAGAACNEQRYYECASLVCTGGKCAEHAVANAAICKGETASP